MIKNNQRPSSIISFLFFHHSPKQTLANLSRSTPLVCHRPGLISEWDRAIYQGLEQTRLLLKVSENTSMAAAMLARGDGEHGENQTVDIQYTSWREGIRGFSSESFILYIWKTMLKTLGLQIHLVKNICKSKKNVFRIEFDSINCF